MSRIILIETSTSLCSTALVEDGRIVSERISDEPRAHASKTAPFVSGMLSERGLKVSDCDAVAVSKGPGSYTGLRVGVSTAKGLCFGAGIPMISVGTLDTLVWQALDGNMLPEGCRYIIPMIDARRMEVYTGIFTPDGRQVSPTTAQIIDAGSFKPQLEEGPVLFIGDGAEKCKGILTGTNASFIQCCPKAASMMHPATEAFEAGKFEDVAYFEPFYLKEFITTVSKKKII
jgi:tRNA threonylcarbamoyladenosine biosynthesis protein TsaB